MAARLLRGGTSARHPGKTFPASRPLPVLCGITLDKIDDVPGTAITAINALMSSAAPYTPVVRVVFDQGQSASAYTTAVADIKATGALVMGELLDSDYEGGADGNPATTTAEYSTLCTSYMNTLGRNVDIWEIGNEVNGSWTEVGDTGWDGSYSLVLAKLAEAYNLVSARGYQTALTLYANYPAPADHELSPEAFSALVPVNIRNGLDYVLLSYYEEDQDFVRPAASVWATRFAALRALYPNAWQGFGEVGQDAVAGSGAHLTTGEGIADYYYALFGSGSDASPPPYYCGGYFWWNWAEDCVPDTNPMFSHIASGFTNEVAALG